MDCKWLARVGTRRAEHEDRTLDGSRMACDRTSPWTFDVVLEKQTVTNEKEAIQGGERRRRMLQTYEVRSTRSSGRSTFDRPSILNKFTALRNERNIARDRPSTGTWFAKYFNLFGAGTCTYSPVDTLEVC